MGSPVFQVRLKKWAVYVMVITITLAIGLITVLMISKSGQPPRQNTAKSALSVGQQAPDFVLATPDGIDVSLSQFRGRPVLINFWATWCVPCREEMPELVRSYEAHKAEGFIILGLNLAHIDSLPDVEKFAQEFKITFPVLLDKDGTVAEKLYRIPGIPTSIFINRDGAIARIQVGEMTGSQVDQYVAEILK